MIDPHYPVDIKAKEVVSKSREHGFEFKCGSKITSMAPLPTRIWHGRKQDDLTGRSVGDFTVIGCSLFMPNNHLTAKNNTRWVVRCKCGRYQILTTKTVKKNNNIACVECQRIKA